ncbi:MAG: orotidine-5'-phosphate decarboxylase [Candidatus Buchananbacteria bacterium]|nr:orotidine-5'-phosphate decarboxylase [Candidatus Buchananbacteria bacterium]
MASFRDRVLAVQKGRKTRLCVGIDPNRDKLPEHVDPDRARSVLAFCLDIVKATAEFACAFELNFGFLAALNATEILPELIGEIQVKFKTPVIVDGKRGDIAASAKAYVAEMFKALGADAATVNPYMGLDTLGPWLEYGPECGIFVLARTSNPGAADYQDCTLSEPLHGFDGAEYSIKNPKLWQKVAVETARQEQEGTANVGLVMGATKPQEIASLVGFIPETTTLLLPGIGKQGGDIVETVRHARHFQFLVNVSSAITHASSQRSDFTTEAASAARRYRDAIEYALEVTVT